MIQFLKNYSFPQLSKDRYLGKYYMSQYLAKTMVPKENPLSDPITIMQSLLKCDQVKYQLVQECWKDVPEFRANINTIENNQDQIIGTLFKQIEIYLNQHQVQSIYDPKCFNPNILFYPGTVIFINQPYDILKVNPEIDFVRNYSCLDIQPNYNFPEKNVIVTPHQLINYQFTAFNKKNNQYLSSNIIDIQNLNIYDKRYIFVLNTYLQQSSNTDYKFKYNENYYNGKIEYTTDTFSCIYLELAQQDVSYQYYQNLTQFSEGHVVLIQRSQQNYLQDKYILDEDYDLVWMKGQPTTNYSQKYSTQVPVALYPIQEDNDLVSFVCLKKISTQQ